MPYRLNYIPNRAWRCYTVRKVKTKPNATGRKIFAKCTTKENALKQLRLLRAIQMNPNFRPYRKTRGLRRSTRKRVQRTFYSPM